MEVKFIRPVASKMYFAIKTDENDTNPKVIKREGEAAGKSGVSYEYAFKRIIGKLKAIETKDFDFGTVINLGIEVKDNLMFVLSVPYESQFAQELLEAIPNLKEDGNYSFGIYKDKKDKIRLSIWDNEENHAVGSAYQKGDDKEKKFIKVVETYPDPDTDKLDKAKTEAAKKNFGKSYFADLKVYLLEQAIENHLFGEIELQTGVEEFENEIDAMLGGIPKADDTDLDDFAKDLESVDEKKEDIPFD